MFNLICVLENQRFGQLVTTSDLDRFAKSWVSDNSRKKWTWVLRLYEEWRQGRNKSVVDEAYLGEAVIKNSLENMSDDEMDEVLAKFVSEVRKADGKEYPGKTLYEMVCCIQAYLRNECKRNITLVDKLGCTFKNLNSALNFQMKERASLGIGLNVKQAKVISENDEDYLWKNGFLGNKNPEVLINTLVWVLGLNFALRAGQEHRNLRFKDSQISLGTDEEGKQYLEYTEDVSKTNSGGLAQIGLKRKTVRAYENKNQTERCPIKLYKEYIAHLPEDVPPNAFYLRPLQKPKGNVWYYKIAAGREKLGNVVAKIMKSAKFEGYYTNHSLRRTCATRMYDKGIPEQLIQETTGHRSSDGVRAYKRTSSSAKRKASEIVQGCPKKVQTFCEVVPEMEREQTNSPGEGNSNQNKETGRKVLINTNDTQIVIEY